jgi:trigger factor
MGGAQGADPSMLPDELFKEQADRRVVLGLVLGEIIGEQNLQADPAKVRESVEELAATYESPDDVINWYYGNKEQLATIESAVVEDQVFDYIIEESVVTDTEVSYQEIIKPEPREDASSEDDDIGSDNTESES